MRILSGIQPSGALHLGNYLGALVKFVRLQDQAQCLYFLADLHAITVWQDPSDLAHATREVTAAFLACGIVMLGTGWFGSYAAWQCALAPPWRRLSAAPMWAFISMSSISTLVSADSAMKCEPVETPSPMMELEMLLKEATLTFFMSMLLAMRANGSISSEPTPNSSSRFRALATNGKVSILSAPSVIVRAALVLAKIADPDLTGGRVAFHVADHQPGGEQVRRAALQGAQPGHQRRRDLAEVAPPTDRIPAGRMIGRKRALLQRVEHETGFEARPQEQVQRPVKDPLQPGLAADGLPQGMARSFVPSPLKSPTVKAKIKIPVMASTPSREIAFASFIEFSKF